MKIAYALVNIFVPCCISMWNNDADGFFIAFCQLE